MVEYISNQLLSMSPAFLVNYINERGQFMEKNDFYNLFGNRHV